MTPAGAAAPGSAGADGEWERFAAALARELADLPAHGVLVLHEPGYERHLVQFVQQPDRLRAEVPGDRDLDGNSGLLPVRDQRLLAAEGWREPVPEDFPDFNWTRMLAWPATAGEYRALADAAVTALRDVQEIASPRALVYRSWTADGTDREVTLPGVRPEPA